MSKIKQAVKHTGKARKEEIVAELVQKLDNSNGVVFADYKGLTHKQLEDLKKELKKIDATIVIAKNSLLKLSLGKSQKYAEFKDQDGLNLPTATLFIQGDMVEPLKKMQKSIKDFGLPRIKFGILEGSLADEAGVLKIASLPNRETLIAQFVGTLNSPISGLVFTLNANIQKFVMTLNAIAQNKPAVAAATPEPAVSEPMSNETPAASTAEASQVQESNPVAEEPAVEAGEPATQPDAPVETDEAPGEPIKTKSEEQTNEGGEEKN